MCLVSQIPKAWDVLDKLRDIHMAELKIQDLYISAQIPLYSAQSIIWEE